MKLRYFFLSALAVLAMLTGCVTEEVVPTLSEFKVDQSYIGFTAAGGSVTTGVVATDNWSFDTATIPSWLTVSPTSGSAGSSNITFSTSANETGKALAQEVKVKVGAREQIFTVKQAAEASADLPITAIKDVIAIGDGAFRIRGTVTGIANTNYGNFYMADETGSIYIYGTFNAKGQYPKDADGGWAGFGVEAGDIVTVEGPYTLYNGTTPELVDATLIKVEKSLITVSPSDVELSPEAGTFELTVDSKVNGVTPVVESSWVRFSDIADKGGKLLYTFAYDANTRTAPRTATITFKAPGALKAVNVSQEGVPPTGATITELVAMEDGSVIETLECTTVAKTTRGIVVSDGTTAIYVYGNQVDNVSIGDNLKIWATKTTYNGVPELTTITGVDVISSGNPVSHPQAKDITADALDYTASVAEYVKLSGTLTVSGNYYNLALDGVDPAVKQGSIVYPVDALDAKAYDGKKITVTGYYNGLSGKNVYLNVIATKIDEYADNPKGTLTNPYSASEIAALLTGGTVLDEDVYIKGTVSAILYDFSASYGTATFWISDDGKAYGLSEDKKKTSDPAHDFECYGVYWMDNTPWAEGNAPISVGDEVVVCGKTTVYNGIAETANKKAWVHSVNMVTSDTNGVGSIAAPFNIAGIHDFIDTAEAAKAAAKAADQPAPVFPDVCVKGKVSAILYTFSASYGTGTFWISDDGKAYGISDDRKKTSDPVHDFECYSVKYLGNQSWVEGNAQIAEGDEVIVKGQYTIYNGTYETASQKAWVYSHNGKTE